MRKYEIMVIINPDTDERQVTPLMEKHLEMINAAGGSYTMDVWGKRKLAYDIQKKSEGIYVVVNLEAAPADVKELDRRFTIDETIMRTKVLRPDLH